MSIIMSAKHKEKHKKSEVSFYVLEQKGIVFIEAYSAHVPKKGL